MKKIFLVALFLGIVVMSYGQKLVGDWNGKLKVGSMSLDIVFHFKFKDSVYFGTMDSPNQSSYGIALQELKFDGANVELEVKNLRLKYTGLVKDSLITGVFYQNGASFPLDLKRGAFVLHRPQEPKSPFEYLTEDVVFKNDKAGIELAGTLTLPLKRNRYKKFPAVVLISGSGAQNRDEELMGHKPFKLLADYLTKRGIAVLRYDDRGVALSGGNFSKSTSLDFIDDALSALEYLRGRREIDASKISLLGHSEGAMIAFVAAAREPKVFSVVSMAGSLLRGDSVLFMQNRVMLKSKGLADDMVESYIKGMKEAFDIKRANSLDYIKQNIDSLASCFNVLPIPIGLKLNLRKMLLTDSIWLDFFVSFNPKDAIKKLNCRVFALNGTKDTQIDLSNLEDINSYLRSISCEDVLIKPYQGLNHLFQDCLTGDVSEYSNIEQTISPLVLEDIALWLSR